MRFPTCPQIPIFVGSEVTFEHKSEDGAEWVIERKCQLNIEAPYLVKKIAGVDYVYFNQKNSLDRRKRTLDIEATNISFSSRIVVKENCTYYVNEIFSYPKQWSSIQVHAENDNWTCFEQSASLDVKNFFGLESAVEKLAVRQYGANLAKGKEILEFFIEELLKSTTHIERFKDPLPEDSTSATGNWIWKLMKYVTFNSNSFHCRDSNENQFQIRRLSWKSHQKAIQFLSTRLRCSPPKAKK